MIKEEEKAIEIVAKYLNFNEICGTRNFKEALETVLSMLKEKDKEIEKKNKIIDLIAEQLAGLTIWDNEKEEPRILADKEEVIKYFEKKSDK